jgi:16S rRNA processing protein RimM
LVIDEGKSRNHEVTTSPDLLLVGRVARAHGNKGQVIVNPETDFPEERFAAGNELIVELAGRESRRRIATVRFHQGRPVIGFDGVDTMNDAEALTGAELKVPASAVAPLPDSTYYRHDLVGCEVRDERDGVIGRVVRVDGTLERSHLVIDGPRGEVMLPLVEEFWVGIDLAARVIVVRPPEGLLDL